MSPDAAGKILAAVDWDTFLGVSIHRLWCRCFVVTRRECVCLEPPTFRVKPFREPFWDCYGVLIHSPNARHQLHSDRVYIYNHTCTAALYMSVYIHFWHICVYTQIYMLWVDIHVFIFIYICCIFFCVYVFVWVCAVLCYVWMMQWSESANYKIRTLN